jgi:ubiquinone/menaquinone biosynthesis C-methylase UbiE
MALRLMQDATIDAACTVLDVGCGVGGPACHVAARTGARVFGLTPNAAQLELARRHAQERGLAERVRFERSGADALPFADASIDVVMFLESASRFPDRARFFAGVQRVLRPGGRLVGED